MAAELIAVRRAMFLRDPLTSAVPGRADEHPLRRDYHGAGRLTVRTTVVLVLAALVAVAASGLAFLTDRSVPAALLAGGAAMGGAVLLFNTVIARD